MPQAGLIPEHAYIREFYISFYYGCVGYIFIIDPYDTLHSAFFNRVYGIKQTAHSWRCHTSPPGWYEIGDGHVDIHDHRHPESARYDIREFNIDEFDA